MKPIITFIHVAIVVVFVILNLHSVNAQNTIAPNTPPYWSLAGNSNVADTGILGTTNNAPLRVVINKIERMRINTIGKVGIGTNTPAARLHVRHNSTITDPQLLIYENENDYARLSFQNTTGSSYWSIAGRNSSIIANERLNFYNSITGDIMSITGDGKIGVKNFNPAATLDVLGGHWDVGSTEGDFRIGNSAYRLKIGVATGGGGAGDARIRAVGGTNRIMMGINDALTINGSGNIGIGNTNPVRKLHVQDGDIRISAGNSSPRYLEFLRTGSGPTQVDFRFEHESSLSRLYLSGSNDDFASFCDIAWFHLCGSPHVFVVNGSALATGGIWQNSDLKLKRDITNFNSAVEIVNQLKPRTYHFKAEEYAKLNLPGTKQYGFIAQDLEKVLPELVQTTQQPAKVNTNGERQMENIKSINYVALIPILTKAMQEQQEQITTLQERIGKLEAALTNANLSSGAKDNAVLIVSSEASLAQNVPNPFTNTTTINYTLPQKFTKAQIIITGKSGNVLKQVNLSGGGKGVLQVDASTLSSGAYNYSLYVEGRLISTKQMILNK